MAVPISADSGRGRKILSGLTPLEAFRVPNLKALSNDWFFDAIASSIYSTSLFPDVIGQAYQRGRVYRTLKSPLESAGDQSKSLIGTNVLWRYSLGWAPTSRANAQAIYHAVEFMGGDCSGLYFFEWEILTFANVYVGLGDGTARAITLPVKGASSGTTAVRANGSGVSGTFSSGTGPNGEDQFFPAATVAYGATIRADFVGRRRRKVMVADGTELELELTPRMDDSGRLMWNVTVTLLETDGADLL